MKKIQFTESIEDRMGQNNTNLARKLYHPRIIEFTLDRHYREMLSRVYYYSPMQIGICLHTLYRQTIYRDDKTNTLFCKLPVLIIPLLSYQGGVFNVEKSTDSSVYFEPYNSNFERRNKSRLDVSFVRKVLFWYDQNITADEISASAAVLGDYQSLVWFDSPDETKLEDGDKVDLDVLKAIISYDDQEQVHIPDIPKMSGERLLIDSVVAELYSKLSGEESREETVRNRDNDNKEE